MHSFQQKRVAPRRADTQGLPMKHALATAKPQSRFPEPESSQPSSAAAL